MDTDVRKIQFSQRRGGKTVIEGLHVIWVTLEHPEKAPVPTDVTVDGMLICVNDVQYWKQKSLIKVVAPNSKSVRLSHMEKAYEPIERGELFE